MASLKKTTTATPGQQQRVMAVSLLPVTRCSRTFSSTSSSSSSIMQSKISWASSRAFGRESSITIPTTTTTTTTSIRTFASLTETEIRKRLDEFQDLFVEARLCIEDVTESEGTKYFDDDAEAAQEAVQAAVDAFEQLIQDIEDPNEKNRVLRGNGLKVEQLKGELDLALKGGHDH